MLYPECQQIDRDICRHKALTNDAREFIIDHGEYFDASITQQSGTKPSKAVSNIKNN